jgi:hypothetical protein
MAPPRGQGFAGIQPDNYPQKLKLRAGGFVAFGILEQ